MRTPTREILRRKLPAKAFQRILFFERILFWSRHRLHWKTQTASGFITRTANVYGYASDHASVLAHELRNVDMIAPTTMCRVMYWHGSDKGLARHNYTTVYSALFEKLRSRPLRIFELGLGTNNPYVSSTMGVYGT
ncbi:MAG: hypothetical protein WAK33_05525, partial [Silvibacterium sp.]